MFGRPGGSPSPSRPEEKAGAAGAPGDGSQEKKSPCAHPAPVATPDPAPPKIDLESQIAELHRNYSELLAAKDREIASLKAEYCLRERVCEESLEQMRSEKIARDSEISSLRQSLCDCEAEKREDRSLMKIQESQISELRGAVRVLESEVLKKNEALKKLQQRQGIGLKEPHVRMSRSVGRVQMADGVYRNLRQDTPCKLKMAFDESQCSRLEREAEILRTIRTNDRHGYHFQHIVTWLYPDRFLTHESDNLYLADEDGDLSPSSATAAAAVSPMKSLVLESGGANLKQFLLSNGSRFSVPVTQRVHILQDIVGALHFLHGLEIVHFDVKPENIVCFSSASGSGSKWKLIDFDSSYSVNLPPSSPGGPPVISCSSSNDGILVTKEYTSPEVMRVLNYRSPDPDRGDPHPQAAPGLSPPEDVQMSWRLDIWSLGLVAVFLFSNHSLWEALHPTRPFQRSMVSGVTQPEIQLLLTRSFGHKEKSFLEACLQVKSADRKPASELLAKSLFSTDNSTTLRLSSDSMSQRFADLEGLLSRYREESQSLVCDELEDKFSDFSLFLSNQLERVRRLSPEEKQSVRR